MYKLKKFSVQLLYDKCTSNKIIRQNIYDEKFAIKNMKNKNLHDPAPTLRVPTNRFGVLDPGFYFSIISATIAGKFLKLN